jgi:cytidine deaminase
MIVDSELLEKARRVAELAYSPYSKARVGCALLSDSGQIYLGCNVENASYGLTMCAERVAIGRAVAEEGPGMRWSRAAVVAIGLEFPPCGACRQVLAEFSMAESRVIFLSQGQPISMGMTELLPAGFTPASLDG